MEPEIKETESESRFRRYANLVYRYRHRSWGELFFGLSRLSFIGSQTGFGMWLVHSAYR